MRVNLLMTRHRLVLAACSARPVVTDVSFAAPGIDEPDASSVPMRIRRADRHIFRYDPDEDQYTEVSTARHMLATRRGYTRWM